jgi:hypothetical protein
VRLDTITETGSSIKEWYDIVKKEFAGFGRISRDSVKVLNSLMAVVAEIFKLSRYKLFP